ncbi:ABC-type multidrug transport system, ATPase component [hydrothermal vent metagenome]|uniref:ABC-type multidrug transport system, ATPase component n=1 Tax=hydrothermal vent metagenome TaxID=652676 RepID=A0A1W1CN02_9ZZZZ
MYALDIKALNKTYKKNKALNNISLTVNQGDFFALLGTNGAGKTTMIGIICGLLKKNSGSIEVFGLNKEKYPKQVKKMIGLMPQEFNFNQFEPVEEILINQAGYYGIDRKNILPRVKVLLKKMDLWHKRKQMARELSGGMKRRLMLARALIHNPKLLILDEPTAGVDVEIRREMWHYLQQLNTTGTTIILTTHYLEEAEKLCKNIAVLKEGVLIEKTSMNNLLQKTKFQTLILESQQPLPKNIDLTFKYKLIDSQKLEINLPNNISLTKVLEQLSKQQIEIYNINTSENRLESLFYE